MPSIAIKAENLSKCYKLGQFGASSLREEASHLIRRLRTRGQSAEGAKNDFWALKNLNFEIEQGDVVGIIGRNGAGKSTLLKLISRITTPSQGEIRLRGKVAALLEVGTGFHQELTGRENIYLNGTILGMKKREIDRKLDEIIAFSGIEKHIDTPVKRYSSGMNVRLGFAVAAHLEPDILIVDEVLAVGDLEFQKKCLSKMQDISGHGRTVLFVSHNMSSIRTVCRNALLLSAGQIEKQGSVDEVIDAYMQGANNTQRLANEFKPVSVHESGGLRLLTAAIESETATHLPLEMTLRLENQSREDYEIGASFAFRNNNNTPILQVFSVHQNTRFKIAAQSRAEIRCRVPSLDLVPGEYYINLLFDHKAGELCTYKSAFLINVEDSSFQKYGHMMHATGFPVLPQAQWSSLPL